MSGKRLYFICLHNKKLSSQEETGFFTNGFQCITKMDGGIQDCCLYFG